MIVFNMLCMLVQFVYVAQAFAPSLDVTLDALYEVGLAVHVYNIIIILIHVPKLTYNSILFLYTHTHTLSLSLSAMELVTS